MVALLKAQTAPAPIQDFQTERQKPNDLFLAEKTLDALPLYENLEKRDPIRAVFAERRAAGLIAQAATVTDAAQKSAILHAAYNELLRAQSLGDTSAYLSTQLDNLKALLSTNAPRAPAASASENGRAAALSQEAEVAFGRADYAAALRDYTAAAP